MEFFLAFHESEKLDDSPDCEGHTMSIQPVCDVESCSTALYFARQEQEVHVVRGHKEGSVTSDEVANKG